MKNANEFTARTSNNDKFSDSDLRKNEYFLMLQNPFWVPFTGAQREVPPNFYLPFNKPTTCGYEPELTVNLL